jgi:hypothetical protein
VKPRYHMHFNPSGDLRTAAWDCEADVFYEKHRNTAEDWVEEYQPYEDTSVFVVITDSEGRAVAVSRTIHPGDPGLKTLVDISLPPWNVEGERSARAAGLDLSSTWDVATIAVRTGVERPGYLMMALLHGLVLTARANRVSYITMILDKRIHRLLHAMGLPNNPLPGTGPAPYAGLPSAVPAWSNIAAMLDYQRHANPEGFRLVSQGLGLDDMTVPAQATFALHTSDVPARPVIRSVLEVA